VRFSDPYWLWAGALACVALAWLWRRYDVRQQVALASFVAPHLRQKLTGSVSGFRRFLQRGLFLLAVLCLFGACAGPELGFHWEKISRRGNEVVFAIDTSRSMLTPDVKPNRLTRAKLAIDDMARQLEGDGIGIVAFAGSAFLVCPLTLDYSAFQQSLDAVDVNTIPLGGTNIASAIVAARDALRRRPGSDRILILVTDGENLQGDALVAAQDAAKQDGLKIYTVGMGSADGELIPLPPDLGGGYVKDESGELVKSHLDESGLKALAGATGGSYVHLVGQGEDFESFLRTVFGAVTKHDLVYRQQRIYNERYQWPLAASLVFLLASLMVGTRQAKRRPRGAGASSAAAPAAGATGPGRATAPGTVVAGPVVALLAAAATLAIPIRSDAADKTNTTVGTRSPLTEYNSGTAAYKAGKFSQATQSFQNSINAAPASDAKRLADQQDAYYNLGNALYRAGQQVEKSTPQDAIAKWTDAVKAYETALQLRADDADSKFNRDFVKRKIDALQQPPDGGGGGGGGSGGGGSGGNGGGKGQPPPPGSGGQGQPPPPGNGQGQPPPQGSNGNQGQPPPGSSQGQPPPRGPNGGQGQPPPQGQPQQPPPGQFRPQPSPAAQGQGQPPAGSQQQASGSNTPSEGADDSTGAPGSPGQMSAEEANALLNSAKSDEHHSLLVPSGPRPPDASPDKPFKNW
jgi:Ca-activated chloride channel homolog